ncbi:hpr1 [Anaeramoeba flamelloides]|uniref:Hpr1 n=1 Tax=Anaeramoeba flamelloides TaxID=1746091 RepID=A0ABQ8YGK1_9EUKA|nr:hpr1 [Anaeramoeba flamelloides]
MENFHGRKNNCVKILNKILESQNLKEAENNFNKEIKNEISHLDSTIQETILELIFRKSQQELISNNRNCLFLLNFAIHLSCQEFLSSKITLLLFEDFFDSCFSIETMKQTFDLLQQQLNWIKTLVKDILHKLIILRTCNQLLERISKTEGHVFYSQIRMFLTNLFPLSEKSGVNLASSFNNYWDLNYEKETATHPNNLKKDGMEIETEEKKEKKDQTTEKKEITKEKDKEKQKENKNEKKEKQKEKQKETETETETETQNQKQKEELKKKKFDYSFYKSFWELQSYLTGKKKFLMNNNCIELIELLETVINKLEKTSFNHLNNNYFPFLFQKYLTSSKVFEETLKDYNFKKTILFQILIYFHSIKAKLNDHDYFNKNEIRKKQLITLNDRTLKLLKKLYPKCFEELQRILQNNKNWVIWKKEKCPNILNKIEQQNKLENENRRANQKKKQKQKKHINSRNLKKANVKLTKRKLDCFQNWKFDGNFINKINKSHYENINKKGNEGENENNYDQFEQNFSLRNYLGPITNEIDNKLEVDNKKLSNISPEYNWKAFRLIRSSNMDLLKENNNLKAMTISFINQKEEEVEEEKGEGSEKEREKIEWEDETPNVNMKFDQNNKNIRKLHKENDKNQQVMQERKRKRKNSNIKK